MEIVRDMEDCLSGLMGDAAPGEGVALVAQLSVDNLPSVNFEPWKSRQRPSSQDGADPVERGNVPVAPHPQPLGAT